MGSFLDFNQRLTEESSSIRIRIIIGLLDPDPDPLVRGMDPDANPAPDPSITEQNIFENYVNVPSKSNKPKNFFFKFVFCWHLEGQ